ncbi:MAG: Uncharacterised protein [Halieaceae bacterium]|nr:MAG: Uncharacterised protein [Halieaceae bacterium]
MNTCTLRIEALKASGVVCAGKILNGLAGALSIRIQVQHAAVTPGMARDDRTLQQRQSIIQAGAGVRKQLLEDRAHGQDSGAAVDLPVIDRARVHLATRSVPAFKECDLEARARQIDAGGQTTCPGADHNGVPGAHATRNLLRIGRVTTRW